MEKYLKLIKSAFKNKGNLKERLDKVYKLEANGIAVIKPISKRIYTDGEYDKKVFSDKLVRLQEEYYDLGFNLSYSNDNMKIEIKTSETIYVENELYLEYFVNDLKELFCNLPKEYFFIDVNIKGKFSNMFIEKKFVISNHANQIGINISQKKSHIFKF